MHALFLVLCLEFGIKGFFLVGCVRACDVQSECETRKREGWRMTGTVKVTTNNNANKKY